MVKMDGSIREEKLAFNPTKDGLFEVLPPSHIFLIIPYHFNFLKAVFHKFYLVHS